LINLKGISHPSGGKHARIRQIQLETYIIINFKSKLASRQPYIPHVMGGLKRLSKHYGKTG
jgi:hypothetical protein